MTTLTLASEPSTEPPCGGGDEDLTSCENFIRHIEVPGTQYSVISEIQELQATDAMIVVELNRPIATDTPANLPTLKQKVVKYSYDTVAN